MKGVRGSAIELNGTSDYFQLGAGAGLNVGARAPFTLALWVWTKEQKGTVLAFRSHPDGLALVWVQLDGGKVQASIRHDNGFFIPHAVKDKTVLSPGEWHHIALSREAVGNLALFVDGALVDHQPPGREATGALTTTARLLGMEPLDSKRFDQKAFGGAIDEFCAFNRALTAEEVARLAGRAHEPTPP